MRPNVFGFEFYRRWGTSKLKPNNSNFKNGVRSTASFVLAISFLGEVVSANPAGLTLYEVLQHIQQEQTQTQTLKFSFTETLSQGSASQKTSGRIFFKRPYQLCMEQLKPEKQTLWSDGKRFSLWSPGAEQVLEGDWKAWVQQTGFPSPLLGFVSDFPIDEWKTRYTVLFGGHDDGLYKVLFKPKRADDAPLELWVSDATFLPARGRLTSSGGRFDIEFLDYEMNKPLSDDRWSIRVPTDTAHVPYSS